MSAMLAKVSKNELIEMWPRSSAPYRLRDGRRVAFEVALTSKNVVKAHQDVGRVLRVSGSSRDCDGWIGTSRRFRCRFLGAADH